MQINVRLSESYHEVVMDIDPSGLPAYSSREATSSSIAVSGPRDLVTHSYSLTNKQGKKWVTLNVLSKARSPNSLPHILEGMPIRGSVELDLSEETSMKSIGVTVSINVSYYMMSFGMMTVRFCRS